MYKIRMHNATWKNIAAIHFKDKLTDINASISLLFISFPLSAGIAVASGASAEAGVISAIIGALFVGLFTSSQFTVVGPAAGLSIFLFPNFEPLSVVVSGLILIILSFFKIHRVINLLPQSVLKGMISGIGLMLILKMIPHLFGYDQYSLFDEEFSHGNSNTFLDIWRAIQSLNQGATTIAILSLLFILIFNLKEKFLSIKNRIPTSIYVVGLGILLNLLFKNYFPELYLQGEHLLHLEETKIRFKSIFHNEIDLYTVLKTALLITSVIVIEGFTTLDILQRLDPKHDTPNFKKEGILIGVCNCFLGLVGALPVMPVLIRSTSNINFGAKSRFSIIFHGILLIVAIQFKFLLSYVPMTSVAAILFALGFKLFDLKEFKTMYQKGMDHFIPFLITITLILSKDLLWGLSIGFVFGLIFSLKSSLQRSMVLVSDSERYLLKFHKDVTFLHKSELKEYLHSIPKNKDVIIDGTGNIFIDQEIVDLLEDYAIQAKEIGTHIEFLKSPLAICPLFKEELCKI